MWNEGQGWFGPKPLFMAGLYSVWYSDNDRISRKKPFFSYNKTDVAAPFGGFKQSGFGKDLGKEALNEYLKTKTITFEYNL